MTAAQIARLAELEEREGGYGCALTYGEVYELEALLELEEENFILNYT